MDFLVAESPDLILWMIICMRWGSLERQLAAGQTKAGLINYLRPGHNYSAKHTSQVSPKLQFFFLHKNTQKMFGRFVKPGIHRNWSLDSLRNSLSLKTISLTESTEP